MSKGLVIVVTGANSGVGFGICQRLLIQLSSPTPSDAQPFFKPDDANHASPNHAILDEYTFEPRAGVTIIMACRDPKRAQDARKRLLVLLDEHVAALETGSDERTYAIAFRKNVKLELESLDLSSVRSVLEFGKTVSHKYEYISHLVFNAGTATYSHFDILKFVFDLLVYFLDIIHHPRSNIQVNGVLSKDNLGYAWQCNVFGHYVLYRSVQDLLLAYTRTSGRSARVIWMSSLDSEPRFDPVSDWQLTKTFHSYEASKYEIELICSELEKCTIEAEQTGRISSFSELVAPHGEIHHLISSPGIASTNMSALLNIPIPGWRWLMAAVFWVARFFGSPHVLTSVYAAAVATVHLALVPLRYLPTVSNSPHISPEDTDYPPWHLYHKQKNTRVRALRFGSENDRWGNERPGVIATPVWEEHPNAGEVLLERFERLYQAFSVAEEDRPKIENGNGAAANGKGL